MQRNGYFVVGLSFLIVFGAAYLLYEHAYAPTVETLPGGNTDSSMSLTLTSSAFQNNEHIPSEYTCDGAGVNPPLTINGVPEGTESLVLVMDDPDIPEEVKTSQGIDKFNHWVIYNISPETDEIPSPSALGTAGLNSTGAAEYTGPCPPAEYEPTEHRYVFRLYAISGTLNFVKAPTLDEVEEAAEGLAIDKAELIGRYERQ